MLKDWEFWFAAALLVLGVLLYIIGFELWVGSLGIGLFGAGSGLVLRAIIITLNRAYGRIKTRIKQLEDDVEFLKQNNRRDAE
jgi:hypothetical protein